MKPRCLFAFFILLTAAQVWAWQPFHDRTHPSKVFGQPRNYRIFLPPDYETSGKRYPVIYYFHGHSDRYTLEHYDKGTDTVPKIAEFAGNNDVIVVSVDGYVARDYTGFYGGSPWDVRIEGGDYDFGGYFQELVSHIDAAFRTLTDRRHRASSGLSMGGFMSLWLSARYPDLLGSASAFNPGPEFYTGDPGRRVLWRPKDHVSNHTQTMVRLIRASGDYISQYHEETREAYARASDVQFEFRQDEYHRHWATSIGETFAFHMRAFGNSALDNIPVSWSHANPYRRFDVWGYQVDSQGEEQGTTYLENVTQGGFRVFTRKWAPDGPPVQRKIRVVTAPLYSAGKTYRILDRSLWAGKTATREATADESGRLTVLVDGSGHQISFAGPGTGWQPPVLLPATAKDHLRLPPGRKIALPLRIYNPRAEPLVNVQVAVQSEYPTVQLAVEPVTVAEIRSGDAVDLSSKISAQFTAGAGYFAPARLLVKITYDGWHSVTREVDVLIAPEILPAPLEVAIMDGRTASLPVFRQKGNQGGGGAATRTVTEGQGNGNGVLEPGEEATIWVKLRQGLDPFDKNNWYRAKVHTDSRWVAEIADIQEQKQLEWTGAKERTSLIRLAPETPAGTVIPMLLDNESWSYHYTPDVRYGAERLYQAFQLHSRHLHRLEVTVPGADGRQGTGDGKRK